MQLLPDHNLRKHPHTYNYSQITTSKNTQIHTTTPRSQPQKTPKYTLLLLDHNLKKHPYTYNYSQITTSKTPTYTLLLSDHNLRKTPTYIQLLLDHNLKRYTFEEYKHKKVGINHHSVYPHLYYFSRLITKTNQKLRCFTLRKQQPNG